jgi:large subunit ribosomal protein L17
MKHRIFGKQLGRTRNERQALFRTQIHSLFNHGSIETTDAKVKALIPIAEKICSKIASKPSLEASRFLEKYLPNRNLARRIVANAKVQFADRTSNFLHTTNIKYRQGDNARIVKLSFFKDIDFLPPVKETKTAPPASAVEKTKKPAPKKTRVVKKEAKTK